MNLCTLEITPRGPENINETESPECSSEMRKTADLVPNQFRFRNLHSKILIGRASDQYAGRVGQIYSKGKYENGVTRRIHKVRDRTFNEGTLPVESVAEYFEHFPLLEIDYTFYRPLLESNGNPTQNFHVLKKYRQYIEG